MAAHEFSGKSDEWYTPAYIFEAIGEVFDLDVAAPKPAGPIPADDYARVAICSDSLDMAWYGFVWMNPPFGGRGAIRPWLEKFFAHGNGIALTPDRTSAPWWAPAAREANGVLFVDHKIKFIRPDGSLGKSPSVGTCLWASGLRAAEALRKCKLGVYMEHAI